MAAAKKTLTPTQTDAQKEIARLKKGGWTTAQLSKAFGVKSWTSVLNWEAGKGCRAENLTILCGLPTDPNDWPANEPQPPKGKAEKPVITNRLDSPKEQAAAKPQPEAAPTQPAEKPKRGRKPKAQASEAAPLVAVEAEPLHKALAPAAPASGALKVAKAQAAAMSKLVSALEELEAAGQLPFDFSKS